MADRAEYHTRQRKELMEYLKSSGTRHLTAAEIKAHLDESGAPIGLATVYRQMDRLVQQGQVRRYSLETGDSACYEYVGESDAAGCAEHFHCKCERCGRLIHMDCDELQAIRAHLLEHHGFSWNSGKTVFYGLCAECRAAAE